MRKRNVAARVEVEDPQVKARVLAVLQALSGEKRISEICQETGLKQLQYYKLEGQLLKGMVLAAQSSLTRGRRQSPLLETEGLEDRNQRLRQENLRMQAMLRLTRKLFKMGSRGGKTLLPRRGRPPKTTSPAKPEVPSSSVPSSK